MWLNVTWVANIRSGVARLSRYKVARRPIVLKLCHECHPATCIQASQALSMPTRGWNKKMQIYALHSIPDLHPFHTHPNFIFPKLGGICPKGLPPPPCCRNTNCGPPPPEPPWKNGCPCPGPGPLCASGSFGSSPLSNLCFNSGSLRTSYASLIVIIFFSYAGFSASVGALSGWCTLLSLR